ncbi:MAG: helix-turn-helix domain-containing protein [Alphaproteobacteria bacterium]|nr:helix-turn-helix domain-containing protein [Alphaproteobacteria bacterium]
MTETSQHVSLIAVPDASVSTLSGIYDVMSLSALLKPYGAGALPEVTPFEVEIVGRRKGPVVLASGLVLETHRGIDDIAATDIVIVPSFILSPAGWQKGRYPELVAWLAAMHDRGAVLCSACSGIFLLAETGLFDGKDATIHWTYAQTFGETFPAVSLRPERVLVVAGDRGQYISSGASTSWHDLVLYLVARHLGPAAAQLAAKFFALQWHRDGLAPYIIFDAPTDHGDGVVGDAQAWLAANFSVASPVEEMVRRSGVAERTFKRRFTKATGYPPIGYVQRLRVEEAKRRLERTDAPIDEIGWQVGYQEPAFFRRLFKRITGVTPGVYRRKFKVPDYGDSAA